MTPSDLTFHVHDDLDFDLYGRSSFHSHDGLPPHQHDIPQRRVVYHFSVYAPLDDMPIGVGGHDISVATGS